MAKKLSIVLTYIYRHLQADEAQARPSAPPPGLLLDRPLASRLTSHSSGPSIITNRDEAYAAGTGPRSWDEKCQGLLSAHHMSTSHGGTQHLNLAGRWGPVIQWPDRYHTGSTIITGRVRQRKQDPDLLE